MLSADASLYSPEETNKQSSINTDAKPSCGRVGEARTSRMQI